MLSFKDLKCKPNGIIHIGAHLGEEKTDYGSIPVIWVEGNPKIIGRLKDNVGDDLVISNVLSNYAKTMTFNIANDTGSSSLNQFNTHVLRYPNIKVKNKIMVVTKSFSSVIRERKIDMTKFNFLVISAGGSEMDILQGFDRYLEFIDCILTKYYEEQIYDDNPNLYSLILYLSHKGFGLNKYVMGDKGWGTAFFVRH
jgi:FkbM family methyltransferase